MKIMRLVLMALGVVSALFIAMVMALGEDAPEGGGPLAYHYS